MMPAVTSVASIDAYVRRQTVMSVIMALLFSAGFFLLIFGTPNAVRVWAPDYLALDFLPQSILASFMSALVPGLQTRAAMVRGELSGAVPTQRWIVLRSLVYALLGMGIATAMIAMLSATGIAELSWATAFAVKLGYGGMLGVIVTPLAVRGVLTRG